MTLLNVSLIGCCKFVSSIDHLTIVLLYSVYSVLCSIEVGLYSYFFPIGDFNINFSQSQAFEFINDILCLLSITFSVCND